MTVSPSTSPADSRAADEAITADRDETKYLVPPDRLDAFAAELTRRLPAHRFTGDGANRLPDPHHYVTTIYFDTPSRALFKTALGDAGRNLKIRAKEYYDLHPSLAELATDPSQIVRYQPWLWFELKRREGARTGKQRFRLPKRDVHAFFVDGRVTPEMSTLASEGGGDGLEEMMATCRGLGEPIVAACLVNYRRLSWQSLTGDLRVTVDRGLAYYEPPADLWTRHQALVRSTLGPLRGTERHAVLEIKHRAQLPEWIAEALARAGVSSVPFSKFVAAAAVVQGDA